MTYKQIWEWIYNNFDINNYFSAEELLYDVRNEFNRTHAYLPIEAEDLVRERFQYRREYAEMQRVEDDQLKAAQLLGNGTIPKSISDQIVEDLNRPEIMGIDVSEYATTREEVIPPEIVKFANKQTIFGRIASTFRKLLRFGR